jgi:hypothetical protein
MTHGKGSKAIKQLVEKLERSDRYLLFIDFVKHGKRSLDLRLPF